MSIKSKILSDLTDITNDLEKHIDSYIGEVKYDINYYLLEQLDDLKTDYFTDSNANETPELNAAFEGVKDYLKRNSDKICDKVEAFWGHEGDSYHASFNSLDESIENVLDKYEEESAFLENEDLPKHHVFDSLKDLGYKYFLTDSQYYQDEILKILREEFNINLVALPAKNN